MKKTYLQIIIFVLLFSQLNAQSTYSSTNYAIVGDSFYLTNASNYSLDFASTGTNFSWNFSTLTGVSQNQLQFRNPTSTGFSLLTFPYIFNSNNTNLSSTDGSTTTLSAFGQTVAITDINDYFKKSTTDLKEVASSYKINYNGTSIPVTNQYTTADVVYQFPFTFGDTDSSNSSFLTNIPGVYYQSKTLSRTNTVDGWGSITTPLGTFPNALRMTTNLIENDTISIGGIGTPRTIRTSRELKWFDTSKKYPVLTVTQSNATGSWVTTKIKYLDTQRDFQTTALFAYTPALPTAGATVYFQNLSTNATTYNWDFDDPASGTSNASSDQNPSHIFNVNGTYQVKLIASNGTFTNTVTIPVVVGNILGINEIKYAENFKIFPNPFTNRINYKETNINSKFKLNSLDGKIVYQGYEISNQDFSYLTKGIYILTVKDSKGSKSYKLIKN